MSGRQLPRGRGRKASRGFLSCEVSRTGVRKLLEECLDANCQWNVGRKLLRGFPGFEVSRNVGRKLPQDSQAAGFQEWIRMLPQDSSNPSNTLRYLLLDNLDLLQNSVMFYKRQRSRDSSDVESRVACGKFVFCHPMKWGERF